MSAFVAVHFFTPMSEDSAEAPSHSSSAAHPTPTGRTKLPLKDDSASESRAASETSLSKPSFLKPLAAPWMASLKSALNHGGSGRRTHSRTEAKRKHVQLATVDPVTGRPTVRTVVFRGFLPQKFVDPSAAASGESCCLCFITDDRSAKFAHLGAGVKHGAPIECCWWLDEAGVQFRVSGVAVIATAHSKDDALRVAAGEMWQRLGDSTKMQMFWPHPGAARGEESSSDASSARAPAADGHLSLENSHFALLIVVPDFVDELRLSGRQKRVLCVTVPHCVFVTFCAMPLFRCTYLSHFALHMSLAVFV
jgi:pyridoxamine 5'-phosphate oxidase